FSRTVEDARRPYLVRPRRGGRALGRGGRGLLEVRAVEQARVAGAAVVVGGERVAGEEEGVELDGRGVTEAEDVGRSLAGPTRDQEDRAARRAGRRQDLDVERDGARHHAGAVERH